MAAPNMLVACPTANAVCRVEAMEVRMKRIIALLMLLITTATLAVVGPGSGSAALADDGVISSRN